MSINKVVYGGKTLIDLTGDTVTADKLLSGITAHGKDGELVTGTCAFDVNSNDATEKAKLTTNNIREGVTILGVKGSPKELMMSSTGRTRES